MKKNKIIIIILCTLTLVFTGIGVILFNIVKEKEAINEKIDKINKDYKELSEVVNTYNEIRTKYIDLTSNFILDKYKDNHEEYVELFTNYNNAINEIDNLVKDISTNCNYIYKDKNANNICSSYKILYEKLVNLYVGDLLDYNIKLSKYNEYKNDNIPEFKMVHNDYVDYNNDNVYEGRDTSEENKEEK